MTDIADLHNPSFIMFPINNNRTAWRPFSTPTILVVPHKRTPDGATIDNSSVFDVRIYIEKVPQIARVAGHDHVGLKFPDRELFAINVSTIELKDRIVSLINLTIHNSDNEEVTLGDAKTGDLLTYTTISGITDTMPYIIGADYYDLSDLTIDVEQLPSDYYNLVYETQYYQRIISQDGNFEFLCININSVAFAILRFQIDHPGKVLDQFYHFTPVPYLTNESKAKDLTVEFYRPFTDILQDVMDEQDILERINWVYDAPPEAIPYLSALLGWDIPYFPSSLDKLRKAVLRRTTEFQNLKGSKRAIVNIFKLFGFEILINNLWWSSDGKRFIRPDEPLPAPYQDQEITTIEKFQIEPILSNWQTSGFTTKSVALLYRPQERAGLDRFSALRDNGKFIIDTYIVETNSEAYDKLLEISNEIQASPTTHNNDDFLKDEYIYPLHLYNALANLDLLGYSQIIINNTSATQSVSLGVNPLTNNNVKFNKETNFLDFTLNGYMDLSQSSIFMFVTYKRYTLQVPDSIINLQSNRFDLQILTQSLIEFADPTTMEFAIEFLYRLKAFHSLLNVIRTRIELTDTYEVTDLSVGGDVQQRWDMDIGRLQVPPAIIPRIPSDLNDCVLLDPKTLGYKESDIIFRLRKLANLPEEHEAWKALDNRTSINDGRSQIASMEASDRDECVYNQNGQDRIIFQTPVENFTSEFSPPPYANQSDEINLEQSLSPIKASISGTFNGTGKNATSNSDQSQYGLFTKESTTKLIPFCNLDGFTDYKYKGRVDDNLSYRNLISFDESYKSKPCSIGIGYGIYWTFPAISKVTVSGVKNPAHSRSGRMKFSGNAPEFGIKYFTEGIQNQYLSADYNAPQNNYTNSFLGKLYRNYSIPSGETIHYTNRINDNLSIDQYKQLALQRPNLNIEKPILHLPGCRFPTLNGLYEDFTHTVWKQKPWDDNYCGQASICGKTDPDTLNAQMIIGSDGNEYLSFDDKYYTLNGNGIIPDISSLGEHALLSTFTAADVIHKVYMANASANPAVTLDQVCDYDSIVADDGSMTVDEPIFDSAVLCNTEYLDYADGYPCVSGYQPLSSDASTTFDPTLYDELGIPQSDLTVNILFLLSSGILIEKGLRLDCGCLVVDCNLTDTKYRLDCIIDKFLDDEGQYDWNSDQLAITQRIVIEDSIEATTQLLDGSIVTLLNTL